MPGTRAAIGRARMRVGAVGMVALVSLGTACTATPSPPGRPPAGEPSAGQPEALVGSPIPQPLLPTGVPVAPDRERVDLAYPSFTHPTEVTNPLFPVSQQASVLFVGHVDDLPFRTEVTLLPDTRVIEWGGQQVETLVSQYTAFLGGRLQEVAYDLYAQADDGSVWYFGEDVADLEHGAVVTKEGTWLAGRDGPAQMIMPGHPAVGDVYRAENIPGIAFEQVTVRSTDRTLGGPLGRIPGGMVGQELHMDGATELKLFAPGYGEFYTGSGGDVEALALAVPTDAADAALPPPLATLTDGARRVLDRTGRQGWRATAADVHRLDAAWAVVRRQPAPRLVVPQVSRALAELDAAVAERDEQRTRLAAIGVARWSLDLELRYRPVTEIDVARLGLWAAQLRLDAARGDAAGVRGDAFALFYQRDRIVTSLSPRARNRVNTAIGALQEAVVDHDLGHASRAAGALDAVARGAARR